MFPDLWVAEIKNKQTCHPAPQQQQQKNQQTQKNPQKQKSKFNESLGYCDLTEQHQFLAYHLSLDWN